MFATSKQPPHCPYSLHGIFRSRRSGIYPTPNLSSHYKVLGRRITYTSPLNAILALLGGFLIIIHNELLSLSAFNTVASVNSSNMRTLVAYRTQFGIAKEPLVIR